MCLDNIHIYLCVYTFCLGYVAACSQYSLSHRHTECNNQAWKKQLQFFPFATGGYNPQCRMCVILTWCLRTYQNGFPCESPAGTFAFIIFVQDIIMQIERQVWRGRHSSAQFTSFLHTNYVSFIFAKVTQWAPQKCWLRVGLSQGAAEVIQLYISSQKGEVRPQGRNCHPHL